MPSPSFRFLHASDFRLHEVLRGLTEIPDRLRDAIVEAPYRAAQRVFDTALAERVQFVVLAGDLLNPLETGARGVAFLLNGFQRLHEADIAVYWAGGRSDPPERWPDGVALPPNVTVFGKGRVEEAAVYLGDRHAATIIGRSWHGRSRVDVTDFARESGDDFRIALTNGELDADDASASQIQYWALGGSTSRRMLVESPRQIAHYPGSPQGFTPTSTDSHGCCVVVVDDDRQLQARALPTDAVRWRTERIVAPEKGGRAELLRVMRDRFRQIAAEAGERTALVTWQIAASCRVAAALQHGGWADELCRDLNQHSGATPVWSVSVEPVTVEQLPNQWYEEDTILGDFLRSIRSFEEAEQSMRLHEFLGNRELDAGLQDLTIVGDAEREQMLHDVALLGAELLRGEA